MNERFLFTFGILLVLLGGMAGCQFRYTACMEEGFSRNYCAAFVLR